MGARSAAKAFATAADAAAAPNPTPARPAAAASRESVPRPTPRPDQMPVSDAPPVSTGSVANVARTAARATLQARRSTQGVAQGSRRFGKAVWQPLVKISGVLWLEITGAFFGLFALFAGQAVWSHRADLRVTANNHDAHLRALVFLAMTLVFSYFCLSSFLRARRRERQS